MTTPTRETAQMVSARPPEPTLTCARCRAYYVDDPDGRTAHKTVFGHLPGQPVEEPTDD